MCTAAASTLPLPSPEYSQAHSQEAVVWSGGGDDPSPPSPPSECMRRLIHPRSPPTPRALLKLQCTDPESALTSFAELLREGSTPAILPAGEASLYHHLSQAVRLLSLDVVSAMEETLSYIQTSLDARAEIPHVAEFHKSLGDAIMAAAKPEGQDVSDEWAFDFAADGNSEFVEEDVLDPKRYLRPSSWPDRMARGSVRRSSPRTQVVAQLKIQGDKVSLILKLGPLCNICGRSQSVQGNTQRGGHCLTAGSHRCRWSGLVSLLQSEAGRASILLLHNDGAAPATTGHRADPFSANPFSQYALYGLAGPGDDAARKAVVDAARMQTSQADGVIAACRAACAAESSLTSPSRVDDEAQARLLEREIARHQSTTSSSLHTTNSSQVVHTQVVAQLETQGGQVSLTLKLSAVVRPRRVSWCPMCEAYDRGGKHIVGSRRCQQAQNKLKKSRQTPGLTKPTTTSAAKCTFCTGPTAGRHSDKACRIAYVSHLRQEHRPSRQSPPWWSPGPSTHPPPASSIADGRPLSRLLCLHGAGAPKPVLVFGGPGAGKTFTVQRFAHAARLELGANAVAIVSAYGVLAAALDGATIHSWAGIGKGDTLEVSILTGRVLGDVAALKRWQSTQVLIVSDASVASAELFDALECVARAVRNVQRFFGGICVVLDFDLMQIEPISKAPEAVR